jgi:hypothetical protein
MGIDFTEEATFYVSFNYLIIINTTKVMNKESASDSAAGLWWIVVRNPADDITGAAQGCHRIWRNLKSIAPYIVDSDWEKSSLVTESPIIMSRQNPN